MQLKQYPLHILSTWRTGRLGALYMNSFEESMRDSCETEQLNRVMAILARRNPTEIFAIYDEISRHLGAEVGRESYEHAAVLRDMRWHYVERVIFELGQ